jgi:hypothetical protein
MKIKILDIIYSIKSIQYIYVKDYIFSILICEGLLFFDPKPNLNAKKIYFIIITQSKHVLI